MVDEERLEEKLEEFNIESDDPINTNITIEEIEELDLDDVEILAQKLEFSIDHYEQMILKAETEMLSEEDLIDLGFDNEDYLRLKALEKALYRHKKELRKMNKEKGVFAHLPIWCAVIGILVFVFNVYPVNPLLIERVLIDLSEKIIANNTINHITLLYLIYFLYVGIFYLTEIVSLIVLFVIGKVKKDSDKMKSFYSYLVITIFDIIMLIPGLVSFLKTMSQL